MSIAALSVAEAGLAAQPIAAASTTKTPRKRQTVPLADQIQAPEAR